MKCSKCERPSDFKCSCLGIEFCSIHLGDHLLSPGTHKQEKLYNALTPTHQNTLQKNIKALQLAHKQISKKTKNLIIEIEKNHTLASQKLKNQIEFMIKILHKSKLSNSEYIQAKVLINEEIHIKNIKELEINNDIQRFYNQDLYEIIETCNFCKEYKANQRCSCGISTCESCSSLCTHCTQSFCPNCIDPISTHCSSCRDYLRVYCEFCRKPKKSSCFRCEKHNCDPKELICFKCKNSFCSDCVVDPQARVENSVCALCEPANYTRKAVQKSSNEVLIKHKSEVVKRKQCQECYREGVCAEKICGHCFCNECYYKDCIICSKRKTVQNLEKTYEKNRMPSNENQELIREGRTKSCLFC